MQWTALRAHWPVSHQHHRRHHHHSPASDTAGRSSAGRFAASGELPTKEQTARLCNDSPLLKPLQCSTVGARLCWISNSRSIPCCPPLRAVNPRSRREWLLLHNLPDSLNEKALNEKESKQDSRNDVAVECLETKIELIGKTAAKGGDPRPDGFPKIRNNNIDVQIETGDFQNGDFDSDFSEDTTEGRRNGAESLEKTPSGGDVWRNRTYQAQGPYTFHGKDGDLETGQLEGSRLKKESSPVATTETGTRLGSSEKTLALPKIWRKDGPSERYQAAPVPPIGTDVDSGSMKFRENKEGFGPGVAPLKGLTPVTSVDTHARRAIWKNGTAPERYSLPQYPKYLQTRSLEESSREEGPSLLNKEIGGSKSGNFVLNNEEGNQAEEGDAGATNKRRHRPETSREAPEGMQSHGRASLLQQEVNTDTQKVEERLNDAEEVLGLLSGKRELVDYNGEKVMEVWRNGRVVKRYKPLGMEFLYGRTKPTRLYGPLNSRGEVPGSNLAPVPRKYRDRCEHGKGWNFREVVGKVLELNHWDDIDVILNQWVGRFNRKNFPPLMLAMTRTGALKHSARLFTWMKNQRCYRARTDIYNLMIWLYARHYRVDAARALVKEMQEWRCEPDVESYNALINVHGRAGQWRESLFYFDRMLRAAVPPSTGTYNNLIGACGNSGQWEKALALYEQMKKDGVYIGVVTHNTLLTALKIGEQYATAIQHFEQTLEWKVVPDTVTLNIVISCFSKMERYDEAVQLFNSMMSSHWDGCRPDLFTFSTIMHVYAVSGQVDNVKAVFAMMSREGVVPNIVSYNTLIGAFASLAMDAEALEVFESMQTVGFEPDVVSYTALMNAYSKAGKPDDAARVFELMRKRSRKPNIVTYNTLMDAYGAAGQVTKAFGLLPDMDFDEVRPNVVTICSLAVACGRGGEVGRISSVLEVAALRKIALNVNVYNTVLSVYLNNLMFDEANKLYATMKAEKVAPDSVTFAVLINGAAKDGNVYQAQVYFDEMLSAGIGINVDACSALIHAYAEQGLAEAAHSMLTRMKECGCEPNVVTYTSLIHAYTLAEMPGAAMTVYDEMDALGVELDAVACSALFTVFNQYGQPEKTLSMWSKRRENFQFGTSAFTQLSNACSMLMDWKTALELFDSMQQVGVHLTPTIGSNLLKSLTKDGKIDRVSEILDRLKADGLQPDLKTYKTVLKCLEKVQLWDTFLEVHDQMMASGCSVDLDLSTVMLDILRAKGQEERAHELESKIRRFRPESERNAREAVSVS